MDNFLAKVREVADAAAQGRGVSVYSVECTVHGGKTVRVSLDAPDTRGISLEDCAEVSKAISKWADEQPNSLYNTGKYTLEVSSLGIDRPLNGYDEFSAFVGSLCKVEAIEPDALGRRRYTGSIKAVSKSAVTIYLADEDAEFEIDFNNIKKANLKAL